MATSQQPVEHVPTDDEINAELKNTNWGKTVLTGFLKSAERNVKVSYAKLSGHFEMLEGLADIFVKAGENVGCSDDKSSVMAFLLGRAGGYYFAAVRLSLSGQLPESYPQLRACIESALYAFNIHIEPSSLQVWLDRHKNNTSRQDSIKLFQPGVILTKLKQVNQALRQEVAKLYDTCIDLGAHPNERSVSSNLNLTDGKISLRLLNTEEGIFQACLLVCVRSGLRVIEIFNLIYPDDFKKFNAEQRMQRIKEQYDRIAPGVSFTLRNPPKP
jgi:hypothetical protein